MQVLGRLQQLAAQQEVLYITSCVCCFTLLRKIKLSEKNETHCGTKEKENAHLWPDTTLNLSLLLCIVIFCVFQFFPL